MRQYITPNDPDVIRDTDSASIQAAVDAAEACGCGKVVIPRMNVRTGEAVWIIGETILLPSDMTVELDNCRLRFADGVFCNMFRNRNMYTPARLTPEGEQHDIRILGRGNAVLDGGVHNGLTERTSNRDGYPHIYHNSFILLHNVRAFELSGFRMEEPRWWCVNLMYCSYGRVRDLDVQARDNVPNQDGIDLRAGCHDILIQNITGQGGDDLIALTGFQGTETRHAVEGKSIDIHSVVVRDIRGSSVTKAIVALRNQDGVKLYNILIDGIVDSSEANAAYAPYAALRIGQNAYVHSRPSVLGETYNITVRNIHSSRNTAVLLCSTLLDSDFSNIKICGSGVSAVSTNGGANLKNIRIDGVYYTVDKARMTANPHDRCGTHNALFNFEHDVQIPDETDGVKVPLTGWIKGAYGPMLLRENNRAEDVYIDNVFMPASTTPDGADKLLAYLSGQAKVHFSRCRTGSADPGNLILCENGAEAVVER